MAKVIYVPAASGGYAAYAVPAAVVSVPVAPVAVVGFKGSVVPATGGGTPHRIGFKV